MERKLTTIFASDVVGFSKMMGEDEVKTLKILKERRLAIDDIIDENDGVIFGSAGDSVIAEFSSPIKASEAAIARSPIVRKSTASASRLRAMPSLSVCFMLCLTIMTVPLPIATVEDFVCCTDQACFVGRHSLFGCVQMLGLCQ